MAVALVILVFLAIGGAVAFVAFNGGPSQARQAYLTGGRGSFRVLIPLIYIGLGIAVPALVIAARPAAQGATSTLASKHPSKQFERGKVLFRETCWSCHTLAAANARGVTGPNLDQIGQINETRVLNALRIGGTGDGRMPAGLLDGADAQAVAAYVSRVAGR
ncbi:MAG: hypothetical protein NVSMB25_07380 [Thermoleophilaceae bacterium]